MKRDGTDSTWDSGDFSGGGKSSPGSAPTMAGRNEARRLYFFHDERGVEETETVEEEPKKTAGLYSRWDDDEEDHQDVIGVSLMDSADGRQGVSEGGRRRYLYEPEQLADGSHWQHDKFDMQSPGSEGPAASPFHRRGGYFRGKPRRGNPRGRGLSPRGARGSFRPSRGSRGHRATVETNTA
eukprot:Gregarina_sp_Poly_1__7163@NODE_392_length_8959_cov_63_078835_g321_i0_p5_GENE_NODE_392_length_8959_cov_63_078835_g321_i0NODE_392_length_8959_cov_63_078835_g321_i0_p5_ORF_typecomplete_len182_score25_78Btz/PF09405_10/0_029Btz/PF09405_10/2e03_NODE_392_length_8959_cov_63_078835_g321_i015912136